MKKLVFISIVLFINLIGVAQHNNNWVFEENCNLNFSRDSISYFNVRNQIAQTGGVFTTWSDCSGSLSFLKHRGKIYNKNYNLIGKYQEFKSLFNHNNYNYGNLFSINDNKFLVLSSPDNSKFPNLATQMYLSYHQLNINPIQDTLITLDTTTKLVYDFGLIGNKFNIYTLNMNNKWLLCIKTKLITYYEYTSFIVDTIYAFKIDSNGISKTPIKNKINTFGDTAYFLELPVYNIIHSNNQFNQLFLINPIQDNSNASGESLWRFDFDENTGIISNQKNMLKTSKLNGIGVVSIGISPNDSLVYIITRGLRENDQFDKSKNNNLLQIFNYHNDPSSTVKQVYRDRDKNMLELKLAPNNKIYVGFSLDGSYLSEIEFPNKRAPFCKFKRKSQYTGFNSWFLWPFPTQLPSKNLQLNFYTNSVEPNICSDTTDFKYEGDTNFLALTWFFGDGDSLNFTRQDLQNLKYIKHKYKKNGTYVCKLKALVNSCGFYQWCSHEVYIKQQATFKHSEVSVLNSCLDAKVTFQDSCWNANEIRVNWGDDSSDFYQTFDSFKLFDFTHSYKKQGQFNIVIEYKNYNNCTVYWKDSLVINFLPKPQPTYRISDCQKKDSLNNKTLYLGCEPLIINVQDTGKENKVSYVFWDNQSQILNQQTKFQKTFRNGNYTAIINDTNLLGCTNTDTFYISVLQTPFANLKTNTFQQCLKNNVFEIQNSSLKMADSVFYEVKVNNSSYNLKPDSVLKLSFTNSGNYPISLIAISKNGCFSQFDSMLIVHPPNTNRLQILKTDSCLSTNEIQANITGNTATNRQQILWGDGQSTDFPINSHRYSAANSYNISLISTTSNNCIDTQSQSIEIYENPQFTFLLNDSVICQNQLAGIVMSNQGPSLTYNINWGDGAMENNLQQGNHSHSFSQSGPFVVAAEGSNKHCKTNKTRNILIHSLPNVEIMAQGFCQNEPTIISATSNAVYQYFWNNNTQANQSQSYQTTYSQIGNYRITLQTKDNNNCQATDSLNLQIVAKPKAAFSFANQSQIQQYQFHFINESEYADGYKWHFIHQNQKDSSTEKSPKMVFADTGFYKTILIANNNNLCFDTAIQTVPIFDKLEFFFPTVFSPNGNGTNDAFGLNIKQMPFVKEYKLEIFNRWGERLFSSTDPRKEWQAANVPIGVYVYQSTIRDVFNILHKVNGVVEVLK